MMDVTEFTTNRLRAEFRKAILGTLDSIRGSKALVLEPYFIQPLGLVAEATVLKEHGVDMFCTTELDEGITALYGEKGIGRVVYLTHAEIGSIHRACKHASMSFKANQNVELYVVLMPRHMQMAEIMFEEEGLKGDTRFLHIPYSWVPLSRDVVSLEMHDVLKELMVESNPGCLYGIAHALYQLQEMFGSASRVQAKGEWSCRIATMLGRMRREAGKNVPASAADGLDDIILMDRTVDMVTPMCTQLTYAGLLDELLGLEYGQIRGKGDSRKVSGLNETDPIFREIGDMFYSGARVWVNSTLKEIQKFRDSEMAGADVAALKGFVSDLREKFARMPLHTSLLEKLGGIMQSSGFTARQKIEADILDDDMDMNLVYDRMYKGDDVFSVLRLMCLYCAVNEGIPKKEYDLLRKDLINTYGFEHIASIHALEMARLLYRKEERKRSFFSKAKSSMGLLVADGNPADCENPEDVHYAYAGYAPMSSRMMQKACSAEGWSTRDDAGHATMRVQQRVNDYGFPDDIEASTTSTQGSESKQTSKKRNVLLVFVGGVTQAEISTLRFLSNKGKVHCNIMIATTSILNGSTLLEKLIK